MNKYFLRAVALLLSIAMIADSATASAFSISPTIIRSSFHSNTVLQNRIQIEALSPRAEVSIRPPQDPLAVKLVRMRPATRGSSWAIASGLAAISLATGLLVAFHAQIHAFLSQHAAARTPLQFALAVCSFAAMITFFDSGKNKDEFPRFSDFAEDQSALLRWWDSTTFDDREYFITQFRQIRESGNSEALDALRKALEGRPEAAAQEIWARLGVRPYTMDELKELSKAKKIAIFSKWLTQAEMETVFQVALKPDLRGQWLLDEFKFARHFNPEMTLERAIEKHEKEGTCVFVLGLGGIGLEVAKYFGQMPGVKLAVTLSRDPVKRSQARRELERAGIRDYKVVDMVSGPDDFRTDDFFLPSLREVLATRRWTIDKAILTILGVDPNLSSEELKPQLEKLKSYKFEHAFNEIMHAENVPGTFSEIDTSGLDLAEEILRLQEKGKAQELSPEEKLTLHRAYLESFYPTGTMKSLESYGHVVESAHAALGGKMDVMFIGLGQTDPQDNFAFKEGDSVESIVTRIRRLHTRVRKINVDYTETAAATAKRLGVKQVFLPGSIHGTSPQNQFVAAYAASKSVMNSYAASLGNALSWGGDYILTPMTAEYVAAVLKGTKLGFFMTPQQVAEGIAWLSAFYSPDLFEGYYHAPGKEGKPQIFKFQDYSNDGRYVVQLPSDFGADVANNRTSPDDIVRQPKFAKAAQYLFKKYPLTKGNHFVFKREVLDKHALGSVELWGDQVPDPEIFAEQGKMIFGQLISALLGTPTQDQTLGKILPGAIYMNQSLEFVHSEWRRYLGQTVAVEGEVIEAYRRSKKGKAIVVLRTNVYSADRTLLATGQARLLVDVSKFPGQWEKLPREQRPTAPEALPKTPDALKPLLERFAGKISKQDLLPVGTVIHPGERNPKFRHVYGVRRGEHGEPKDVIVQAVRPQQPLGDYDVRMQVMAASLNFNGSWGARGLPVSPFTYPLVRNKDFQTLGSDESGVVTEVGPKVTRFKVGDKGVMATGADDRAEAMPANGDSMEKKSFHITGYEDDEGTFSQFWVGDERQVLPMPDDMFWEDASSYMLAGATAWRTIKHKLAVKVGDTVLIWGAWGGTGIFAIQAAKLLGAKHIIGVVSSEQRGRNIMAYGATGYINRKDFPKDMTEEQFREILKSVTNGELADAVVDPNGVDTYHYSVGAIKDTGKVAHFAGTTGYRLTFKGRKLDPSQTPESLLKEAGLAEGKRVVSFGADETAHKLFERVKEAGAQLVLGVANAEEAAIVKAWDPEGKTLRGTVDMSRIPVPDVMPRPPHPDYPSKEDDAAYEKYRVATLDPFRQAVSLLFENQELPDIIVERPNNKNTLDISAFTVRPHGSVVYIEDTDGRDFVFDARFVWMFQKKILPWIIGSHYANHEETAEFNELVRQGKIRVPAAETYDWKELPEAQQRFLEGKLTQPKASVLVGASERGLTSLEEQPARHFASSHRADETEKAPIAYWESSDEEMTVERVQEMMNISGDENAVHKDDAAAQKLDFKGRIAHGMLVGSLIPRALRQAGWLKNAEYVGQDFTFLAPVYMGDKLRTTLEVIGADYADKDHVDAAVKVRTVVMKYDRDSEKWKDAIVGTAVLQTPAPKSLMAKILPVAGVAVVVLLVAAATFHLFWGGHPSTVEAAHRAMATAAAGPLGALFFLLTRLKLNRSDTETIDDIRQQLLEKMRKSSALSWSDVDGIVAGRLNREEALALVNEISWQHFGYFGPLSDQAVESVDSSEFRKTIGVPGTSPNTRSIHPSGYVERLGGRPATVRRYSSFGTAVESNQLIKKQIEQGATGLSIAYDLPTQNGFDSDHPKANGEVGKVGVAIDSLRDVEDQFAGIDMSKLRTSMTINASAPILLAMYVAAAQKQGAKASVLNGTIQNEVLKEYLSRGTQIYPYGPAMRLTTDVFQWAKDNVPHFNTITFSGYHPREKGANEVQEVAYAVANALQYLSEAKRRGLNQEELAAIMSQVSWFMNLKTPTIQEVAKYRALRRIWAALVHDALGIQQEKAAQVRVQSWSGGSDVRYAVKPQNNIARNAVRMFNASAAGSQGWDAAAFDEGYAIPDEFSSSLVIDGFHQVQKELGVTEFIDPLGGSYYLEADTRRIEDAVWSELAWIASLKSYPDVLEQMTDSMERQSAGEISDIEAGIRSIVGLNMGTEGAELFPAPEARETANFEGEQKERLARLKAERDNGLVETTLGKLEQAARGKENLMPYILEAVKAYATVGEISDRLRRVFGVSGATEPWIGHSWTDGNGKTWPMASQTGQQEVFTKDIRKFIFNRLAEESVEGRGIAIAAFKRGYFLPSDVPFVKEVNANRASRPGQFPYRRGLPLKLDKKASHTHEIDGYSMREQGATAVQELAFSFYQALKYIESQPDRSLAADSIRLKLSADQNFYQEVAKFRAAREVWAQLMKNQGIQDPGAQELVINAKTSASTLSPEKVWLNVHRITWEGLAALLGGVQSVEITAFDTPYGETGWTPLASQMSKDIQAILEKEVELNGIQDPLGGSYVVEAATDAMVREVQAELDRLWAVPSDLFGAYKVRTLEQSHELAQVRRTAGLTHVVGETIYPAKNAALNPKPPIAGTPTARIAHKGATFDDLVRALSSSDEALVKQAAQHIYDMAKPLAHEARQVLGATHKANPASAIFDRSYGHVVIAVSPEEFERVSNPFGFDFDSAITKHLQIEIPGSGKLVVASDPNRRGIVEIELFSTDVNKAWDIAEHLHRATPRPEGRKIRVLVGKAGLDGHDRGAKLVSRILRDAGMEVIYTGLKQTPEQIVNAALQEDVDVIGVSTLADGHNTSVPEISRLMHEKGLDDVLLVVGGVVPQSDQEELAENAGVGRFYSGDARTEDIVRDIRAWHAWASTPHKTHVATKNAFVIKLPFSGDLKVTLSPKAPVNAQAPPVKTPSPRIQEAQPLPRALPLTLSDLWNSSERKRLEAARHFALAGDELLASVKMNPILEKHILPLSAQVEPHKGKASVASAGLAVTADHFDLLRQLSGNPGLSPMPPSISVDEFEIKTVLPNGGIRILDVLRDRPASDGKTITKFIARSGEGIQQIEAWTPDMAAAVAAIVPAAEKGLYGLSLVDRQAHEGANGTQVFFVMVTVENGRKVLLELVQRPSAESKSEAPRTHHAGTLLDQFQEAVKTHPNQTIQSAGETQTYKELDERSNQFANALIASGVEKGDRVAVMLPAVVQELAVSLGLWKVGAIRAPFKNQWTSTEIRQYLKATGTRTLIIQDIFYTRELSKIISEFPGLDVIVVSLPGSKTDVPGVKTMDQVLAGQPTEAPHIHVQPEDLAQFAFSSGTTGEPRVVALTHNSFAYTIGATADWMKDIEAGPAVSAVPPGTYGTHVVLASIAQNRPVILVPRLLEAQSADDFTKTLAEALAQSKAKVLFGVPTTFHQLAKTGVSFHGLVGLSRGSALGAAKQEFEHATGARVIEGYGLTEANSSLTNPVHKEKSGTVGIPSRGTSARIIDPETLEEMAPGQIGELIIKGPQVMEEYWGDPHGTAKTFIYEGWLRTGDLGRMDAEGYVTITGRLKDIIVSGSENILPHEVENVLSHYHGIRETAVVGIQDPDYFGEDPEFKELVANFGEVAVAFVVAGPGADLQGQEQAIREFSKKYLAAFKVPHRVVVVHQLPRFGDLSKPDRNALRNRSWLDWDRLVQAFGGDAGAAEKVAAERLDAMKQVDASATREAAIQRLAWEYKTREVENVFPGDNWKFMLLAAKAGKKAPILLLDLEDAVATPRKELARHVLIGLVRLFRGEILSAEEIEFLKKNALQANDEKYPLSNYLEPVEGGFQLKADARFHPDQMILIRPNNLRTKWSAGDYNIVFRTIGNLIDGFYMPKVDGPEDVRLAVAMVHAIQREQHWVVGRHKMFILTELPGAVLRSEQILAIAPEVEEAQLGVVDYTAATGGKNEVQIDQLPYMRYAFHWLSQAGKKTGKASGTGITVGFSAEATAADTKNIIDLGINRKWSVHPSHLEGMSRYIGKFPTIVRKDINYEKLPEFDLKLLEQWAAANRPIMAPHIMVPREVVPARSVVEVAANHEAYVHAAMNSKADMVILDATKLGVRSSTNEKIADIASSLDSRDKTILLQLSTDVKEAAAQLRAWGPSLIGKFQGIVCSPISSATQLRAFDGLLTEVEKEWELEPGALKIAARFQDPEAVEREARVYGEDANASLLHASQRLSWAFLDLPADLPKEAVNDPKTRGYNYYRSLFIAMTAEAEVDAIDGYSQSDADLAEDTLHAANWGYQGKLTPLSYVDQVNDGMNPQRAGERPTFNLKTDEGKKSQAEWLKSDAGKAYAKIWKNSVERDLELLDLYAKADQDQQLGAVAYKDPITGGTEIVDAASARIPYQQMEKAHKLGLLTEPENSQYLAARERLLLALRPGGREGSDTGVFWGERIIGPAITVRGWMVKAFAKEGDRNRYHLDEEYAKASKFKGLVAHGLLTASLTLGELSRQLPAYAVNRVDDIRFKAPVRFDDTVTPVIDVLEVHENGEAKVLLSVINQNNKVIGEIKVSLKPQVHAAEKRLPVENLEAQQQTMAWSRDVTASFPDKIYDFTDPASPRTQTVKQVVTEDYLRSVRAYGNPINETSLSQLAAIKMMGQTSADTVPGHVLMNVGPIEFGVPVKVGDTLTATATVPDADKIQRAGGTGAPKVPLTIVIHNQRGEQVLKGQVLKLMEGTGSSGPATQQPPKTANIFWADVVGRLDHWEHNPFNWFGKQVQINKEDQLEEGAGNAPAAPKTGEFLLEGEPTWPAENNVHYPEQLSQDEDAKLMHDTIEEFVKKEVVPRGKDIDSGKIKIEDELRKMAGEMGLLGMAVPEEFGGMYVRKIVKSIMDMWAWYANPSFASLIRVHGGVGTMPIVRFGTEEQKQKYLPKLASGEWIGAYALTEQAHGSDTLGRETKLETTAKLVKDGDQEYWVINGNKRFVTNGRFAKVFIVFAMTGPGEKSVFIVESGEGVDVNKDPEKMGLHGSSTADVFFVNVRVPKENLLGKLGQGNEIGMSILNHGRTAVAAGSWGGSQRVFEETSLWVIDRKQFGRPLADLGAVQETLADMEAYTYAQESVVYALSGLFDAGEADPGLEASAAKVWCSETLKRLAAEGVQKHGGNGFITEYIISHFFQDSTVMSIFEGANEMLDSQVIASLALKYLEIHKHQTLLGSWSVPENSPLAADVKAVKEEAALNVHAAAKELNRRFGGTKAMKDDPTVQSYFMAFGKMIAELYALTATINRTQYRLAQGLESSQQLRLTHVVVTEGLKRIELQAGLILPSNQIAAVQPPAQDLLKTKHEIAQATLQTKGWKPRAHAKEDRRALTSA